VALKATDDELRRDGIDRGELRVNTGGDPAAEKKANEDTDHSTGCGRW
jgi:hypothetical protein